MQLRSRVDSLFRCHGRTAKYCVERRHEDLWISFYIPYFSIRSEALFVPDRL